MPTSTNDDHTRKREQQGEEMFVKPQVFACGLNTAAQLDCSTPEPISSFQRITKIACGRTHCLALNNCGELWSWGSGMGWKLGLNNTRDAVTAQQIVICERFHHGKRPCCILTVSGVDNVSENMDGAPLAFVTTTTHSMLPKIRDIACGEHHSVCVDQDGLVYTWGLGREGQLGVPTMTHHLPVPRALDPVYFNHEKVVKVAANSCFTMAITENGFLYSWGWGGMFRLGHGDENTCPTPKLVEYFETNNITIKSVSCGWRHTCCITSNGHVYSWGDNTRGQLGLGDRETRKYPEEIPEFCKTPAEQVACGDFFTLVLTCENILYGFGNATSGELASEQSFTIGFESVPKVLESVMLQSKLVSHISAGSEHACAVSVTGSAWCWGSGEFGQIGNESVVGDEAVYIPIHITLSDRIFKVFCGETFTLFITEPPPSVQISEQTLIKDFQNLMNTERTCNISLRVSDGSIHVHAAIIAARSRVLKSLILKAISDGETTPKIENNQNISLIEIDLSSFGFNYFELRSLVEYIYTGSLYFHKFAKGSDMDPEIIANRILECAMSLDLHNLAYICQQFKSISGFNNYKLVNIELLQHDLVKLINDDVTSDFRIVVHSEVYTNDSQVPENKITVFKVHQCVLMARSEHFRLLIQSNMRETQEREVHLHDINSIDNFLQMLRFLYSDNETEMLIYLDREDTDSNPRETRVFNMLTLADIFMITRLKQICEHFIEQNYGIPNQQLRDFANQFQADQLRNYCDFYLRQINEGHTEEHISVFDTPMEMPLKLAVKRSNNLEQEENEVMRDEINQDEASDTQSQNSAFEIILDNLSQNENEIKAEEGSTTTTIEDTMDIMHIIDANSTPSNSSIFHFSELTRRKKKMLVQRWNNWIGQYNEQRFKDKLRSLQRQQTWNKVSGFIWRLIKKLLLAIFLGIIYIPFFICTFLYGIFLHYQTIDFDRREQ
jgi:alpha-tubulin suppressor-like RCC1 family protein